MSAVRIELGKLYYLRGDQLNAGFQWWPASEAGADVLELSRLASNNFRGHELRELGFKIARSSGLEYLTAFDYQGPEAGSFVWGEMVDSLSKIAVRRKYGISPSDLSWESRRRGFHAQRRKFDEIGDSEFVKTFGDVVEVRQYIDVMEGLKTESGRAPRERDGLTLMRWYQSKEYEESERRSQLKWIRGISFGGFGEKRWKGIRRRNELMLDYAVRDVRQLGKRKILIIVGSGHKFDFEDHLKDRSFTVVPSRGLIP